MVIACYTEERLESIKSALTSIRKQSLEPQNVVVACDNNEPLANRLREEFDWIQVVLNDGDSGASATRNRGLDAVGSPFTAFLDDDETADPDWLLELTRPFADNEVVGTGGKYEAVWSSPKPAWFPDEFAWAVGGAYLGMPTETAAVRNVWSGNMAVRTSEFRKVEEDSGRASVSGASSRNRRTPICASGCQRPGAVGCTSPRAVIFHDVPPGRTSFRFFISRCFSEGAGKAVMRAHLATGSAVQTEHAYVRTAALAAIKRFGSSRRTSILQGLVIMLGLASAATGYIRGLTVQSIAGARR